MNIVESLKKLITDKASNKQTDAPEGVCPNCWGREEYEGKFFEAVNKHGKDLGWVQEYVVRKVNMETYLETPDQYDLRKGVDEPDAPLCPYGNTYEWIGYDKKAKEYVRFTKSVFKLLVKGK